MKLAYPVNYEKVITQHFGENGEYYSKFKIGGVALKGHEGIDLRAPAGTVIYACDDGFCQEVIDQGNTGYGKYIKIIHAWGESVYAHLQEFKVKQGTQVKKGQTIALADNTGNSNGSHLHFGIRVNPYNRADGWGGYSDPEPYLFDSQTGGETDMPEWAKKLQPYFIELNLKDDQIEPVVRGAIGDSKILHGFIEKWADMFELTEENADLSHIEGAINDLIDTKNEYIELVSTAEELVGHFDTETGLRNALRVLKADIKEVSDRNTILEDENKQLRAKRNVDKYGVWELQVEVFKKLFNGILKKLGVK